MKIYLLLSLILLSFCYGCKRIPETTLKKVQTRLTMIDMETNKPLFPPINQDSEILIGLRGDITIYMPSKQIKEIIQQVKDGKTVEIKK